MKITIEVPLRVLRDEPDDMFRFEERIGQAVTALKALATEAFKLRPDTQDLHIVITHPDKAR